MCWFVWCLEWTFEWCDLFFDLWKMWFCNFVKKLSNFKWYDIDEEISKMKICSLIMQFWICEIFSIQLSLFFCFFWKLQIVKIIGNELLILLFLIFMFLIKWWFVFFHFENLFIIFFEKRLRCLKKSFSLFNWYIYDCYFLFYWLGFCDFEELIFNF